MVSLHYRRSRGVLVLSHCGFNLCISLMTNDDRHVFMCILAMRISAFAVSVQTFAYFYYIVLQLWISNCF